MFSGFYDIIPVRHRSNARGAYLAPGASLECDIQLLRGDGPESLLLVHDRCIAGTDRNTFTLTPAQYAAAAGVAPFSLPEALALLGARDARAENSCFFIEMKGTCGDGAAFAHTVTTALAAPAAKKAGELFVFSFQRENIPALLTAGADKYARIGGLFCHAADADGKKGFGETGLENGYAGSLRECAALFADPSCAGISFLGIHDRLLHEAAPAEISAFAHAAGQAGAAVALWQIHRNNSAETLTDDMLRAAAALRAGGFAGAVYAISDYPEKLRAPDINAPAAA